MRLVVMSFLWAGLRGFLICGRPTRGTGGGRRRDRRGPIKVNLYFEGAKNSRTLSKAAVDYSSNKPILFAFFSEDRAKRTVFFVVERRTCFRLKTINVVTI